MRLWTSAKAQMARFRLAAALALAMVITIFYGIFYSSLSAYPFTILILLVGYAACLILYLTDLHPHLLVERAINRDLADTHHVRSADQDVSVTFDCHGQVYYIFFQDFAYYKNPKEKTFYRVFSNPMTGSPQIHFISINTWGPDSFTVVTEKLENGAVVSTVFVSENN